MLMLCKTKSVTKKRPDKLLHVLGTIYLQPSRIISLSWQPPQVPSGGLVAVQVEDDGLALHGVPARVVDREARRADVRRAVAAEDLR